MERRQPPKLNIAGSSPAVGTFLQNKFLNFNGELEYLSKKLISKIKYHKYN